MGPLQVGVGQIAGCEAAIHAMRELYSDASSEAALLVDASNAFNSVNRQAALDNISVLCPSLSVILHNAYGTLSCLFVTGQGRFLQVREQLRAISLQCQCMNLQWCP